MAVINPEQFPLAIPAKLELVDTLKADIAAQREEIATLKVRNCSQGRKSDEGESSWRGRHDNHIGPKRESSSRLLAEEILTSRC